MATDLISIFIGILFMTIEICILIHVIFSEFELYENFLAMLIPVIVLAVSTALAFIAVRSYSQSNVQTEQSVLKLLSRSEATASQILTKKTAMKSLSMRSHSKHLISRQNQTAQ